jgi:hypothetical protein
MAKHPQHFVTVESQIEEYTGISREEKTLLLAVASDLWEEAEFSGSLRFDFVSPDVGESRFVPVKDPAIKFTLGGIKYTSRMTYECLYVEDAAGLGVAHRWR